jgi:signal transduction histidine kinase
VIVAPFTDPSRPPANLVGRLRALAWPGAGGVGVLRRIGDWAALPGFGKPDRPAEPSEPPGKPRRFTLRIHPWLPIAAVTGLLIAAIVPSRYYFIAELRDDALRTAQSNLSHESTALAEQADSSFKSLDLVLSSVGDYVGRKGVTDGESYRRMMSDRQTNLLLAEKITGLPFVDALLMIDAQGRRINFSRAWPVSPGDVSDRDYFQALKNDPNLESFISKPVKNRATGVWDIYLARRLSDPNGEFMGLLVGVLRVQSLENFFRSTLPADGTTVSLLRADGMLLAGAPRTQELGTYPLPDQGFGDEPASLSAARLLASYPLLVLASRSEESALQGWRVMAHQMAAMTGGSVLVLLIAAVVIARWRSQQAHLARVRIEKSEAEAERTKALREIEMRTVHEARLAAERTKLREVNAELTISKERAEAAIARLEAAEAELHEKARTLEEYASELKRSNSELEQFAYVASHDLQEPLRMVASYCQLLKRRYADKLDASAGEFIDFAVDGASRMQQLIKDLLAFSRVGRSGGSFEPLDMNAIVEVALGNLAGAIADSGARIERGALPRISGERALLAQVFQNLIGNAIKFRRDEPPVVRISAAAAESGFAHFTVEDNGIGIDAGNLERAFVIFQRVHDREKYAGTGIGLAIVKKVIEHHGGRIWIESTVGQGSRFQFTLPIAADAEVSVEADGPNMGRRAG